MLRIISTHIMTCKYIVTFLFYKTWSRARKSSVESFGQNV